ncbi:MAG TPA: serine hydrolase [Gemmatimonadales bacterium]|nr:serine hydrolase [Gemmatimonadales bacterium]
MNRALFLLATSTLAVSAASAQTTDPLRGFDRYVEQARKDWGVPGLAIAVIKGDSVVFIKGYGVRSLSDPAPVTTHTLFANASTTKAFTAMAVGQQVDAGKMSWDDPLSRWIPGFELRDPLASRDITVRDALTHVVGFGDPEYLWTSGASFDAMLPRLKLVPATASFRSRFQYNNVTYAAAGFAAGRAAGSSWAALVRSGILQPLGMTETVFSGAESKQSADVARPHFRIGDSVRVIPNTWAADSLAPAGAMISNVTDMARWIRALLDSGRVAPGGRRLISAANFAQLLSPQVEVRDTAYPTAALAHPHFSSYGFGWFLQDYRGRFVAFHTGSLDGFSAIVGLIPDERVGVVVFANLDHAEVRHALMYKVFDAYIGGAQRDWSKELLALYGARRAAGARAEVEADRHRQMGTKPSHPLTDFAGAYADSLYGQVIVRVEGDHLVLSSDGYGDADLSHWHFDTFRGVWRRAWQGHSQVTFATAADGSVASLEFEDMQFHRQAGGSTGMH